MRALRALGFGAGLAGVALGSAWLWLALGFQLAPAWAWIWRAVAAFWALALVIAAARGRLARLWAGIGCAALAAGIWWVGIAPRADRDWAPDVAHGVTADITPGRVTIHNLRDFDWTSPTEATPRWSELSVDPARIISLDVALSTWGNPDIAHTLVSFGFDDGRHVVFSSEIRKEKGERYSPVGGFFRQYELVLIAAEERDILRLRTDLRRETVSLYPIEVDPALREALFLSFLRLGNDLAEHPRWYNTLTGNCTTIPFHLVRQLGAGVPFDSRVILSGRLPGYFFDLGILPGGMTLDEITARARLVPQGAAPAGGDADFSRRLRLGWSG